MAIIAHWSAETLYNYCLNLDEASVRGKNGLDDLSIWICTDEAYVLVVVLVVVVVVVVAFFVV